LQHLSERTKEKIPLANKIMTNLDIQEMSLKSQNNKYNDNKAVNLHGREWQDNPKIKTKRISEANKGVVCAKVFEELNQNLLETPIT